jgi:hypothetical protein
VYLAIAGKIVAMAGMGSARYYIFAMPLMAIAFGVVLGALRDRWAQLAVVVLVVGLAAKDVRHSPMEPREDFREMTFAGIQGLDSGSLILYPWAPNRDLYRIYLERYLHGDPRPIMVGISSEAEIPQVCERLKTAPHVAVLAHAAGRSIIDSVYAACGSHWPARQQHDFHITFAEHWRTAPATDAKSR